jgi:hypothetical protein
VFSRQEFAGEAAEIWNALCRRRLLSLEPLDPAGDRLVTNGDFLQAPSGRGFDWRLVEQTGVTAAATTASCGSASRGASRSAV